MAGKIRWSPRSVANLEQACEFIARDSPHYAAVLAKRVISIVEGLPEFPRSGRVVPEYQDENLREKIFQSYRIVYRIKDDIIEVAAICHGALPLPGM